jgi:hypothetical protein
MADRRAHYRLAQCSGIARARDDRAEILEDPGSRLVGPGARDAPAGRQRHVHFLRVVRASVEPISQILAVSKSRDNH